MLGLGLAELQHVLVEGKHVNKALNVEHSQTAVDVDIVNFTKVKLSDMEDFHHWNDRLHVSFFFFKLQLIDVEQE